jgi:DNA methylase
MDLDLFGPSVRESLKRAALDPTPVTGLTHALYRYPARFSPVLAGQVVELLSRPGDIVWDPFSGGGTTVVEAFARGRRGVATDINTLATFVARLKTLQLTGRDRERVVHWADMTLPGLRCSQRAQHSADLVDIRKIPNLSSKSTWPIRDFMAVAVSSIPQDLSVSAETAVRGAILAASQWALDGRRTPPRVSHFRAKLQETVHFILNRLSMLWEVARSRGEPLPPIVDTHDVISAGEVPFFSGGELADLVLTSPPYPGVHVLYHRWQVGGGRETSLPYWIAASRDGQGEAYYTMSARRSSDDRYFQKMLPRLEAIHAQCRGGALFVQVVGFAEPRRQLRKYLRAMEHAGFEEFRSENLRRLWRPVPGRKWHAVQRPQSPASREVVLVHQVV